MSKSQTGGHLGRPSLPGRGPHKIGASVDDSTKKNVETRAKALNMSVAAYVFSLISKDLNANKTETLLETA